jgi:hypothetical protein
VRGCSGQFIVRACCSSTTAPGRPSREARASSGSCKPPSIGCAGRAALPGASGWVLAIEDVGAHLPRAPDSRWQPMLARTLDLLPTHGLGAQPLPTKTVRYCGYELTIHAPISGGDRWHVVIRPPNSSPRSRCRSIPLASRPSRKHAPPSIAFWMTAARSYIGVATAEDRPVTNLIERILRLWLTEHGHVARAAPRRPASKPRAIRT